MGIGLLAGVASVAVAGDVARSVDALSKTELASVIRVLGDDLLEGRAPGTRGGDLAELVSEGLLSWMGLAPGWRGGYLQPFDMKGFATTTLSVEGRGQRLQFLEEVVGNYLREKAEFDFEAEAVFAGFGVRTPLWEWDDYKDADVRGRILVVRVNDPGSVHPDIFEGSTLTYYGRWRYKIEEAARAGARGILLVHTDASAGYGWHVVRNSWGGEGLHLPASLANDLEFAGWIAEPALRRLLAGSGAELEALYAASQRRDFRPIPLGFSLRITGRHAFRTVTASNVVAEIPGRSKERVVLVAHIDHLGRDERLAGDQIYNGAIDNGSAVAALLLTARILKEHQSSLNYSVTVLACHAEEEGLLGSTHYVAETDRGSIVAAINFESTPVWGPSGSVMGVGAQFSTLEDLLQEVATRAGVKYSEFSMSEQGFFFRSDQFPFARAGIPALWISAGEDFASGRNHLREFFTGSYHTPRDEFDPAWELESLRQTVRYAVMLVEAINQAAERPRWKRPLTFPLD